MGRFLFTAWPYAGHVHPCIALALRLRERGHKVAFYTGAFFSDALAGEGFERFAFSALAKYLGKLAGDYGEDDPAIYRALNHRYTTVTEANPVRKFMRVQQLLSEMTAGSVPAQIEDLRRIAKDWRPDVVITDPMMWAPIVALHESIGLPVVPFSFYAGCLMPGPGLAPPGFGFPPAKGWVGKCGNAVVTKAIRTVTTGIRKQVNRIRESENLPALSGSVHQHSGRMPLYIVASSREFDYSRCDLPPSVEYAGPCLWENNARLEADEPLHLSESTEVIYVSEGTAQVGKPFLLLPTIEALANENVQVVATTGLQRTAEVLGKENVSRNVVVRQWISQMALFKRTSLAITTGGSGTVRQALWFGVPLLVAPLEWDQAENAQRITNCGAGMKISVASCNADRIGKLVRELRANSNYRTNAKRIGESFRRAAASTTVLERLEHLISRD